jgi:hypothetical protein
MPRATVAGVVELLNAEGHAALVLKDPSASPHDYLVVAPPGAALDPVSVWWFDKHRVSFTTVRSLEQDEHPEWTVRVGACAPAVRTVPIRDELARRFGDGVVFHSFPAVAAPAEVSLDASRGLFHVVEAFDAGAHKWAGIRWVCGALGIDPSRTAAIGDEINDLPMIRHAGLGIAMGNAVDDVRRAAARHTASNHELGLAQAVDRLLDGSW